MYALTWRRHSGRLQEDLILYARGLVPSLVGSTRPSNSYSAAAHTRDACGGGRFSRNSCTFVSKNRSQDSAFKRTSSRLQVSQVYSQGWYSDGSRLITTTSPGLRPFPPSFSCRYSLVEASTWKLGSIKLPGGLARYLSSGDRDDRDSDERQQATPLADGEGDEQEIDEARALSMRDAGEEGSSDDSISSRQDVNGGEDDGEECREQANSRRESAARKLEDEKEEEEAISKAAFRAAKARFRKEFEKRAVEWHSIDVSLENFPYFLSDTTRELLLDCVGAHLRQPTFSEFGSGLPSSNRMILLCGQSGTELYQEKLVEAIAHDLQASLLVVDSSVLSPDDFGNQESSSESDTEGREESHFDEWGQSQETEVNSEGSHDENDESETDKNSDDESHKMPVVTLVGVTSDNANGIRRKLLEVHNHNAESDSNEEQRGQEYSEQGFSFKKGDRVKYVGSKDAESSSRTSAESESASTGLSSGRQVLKAGQRGRVVSVPRHMTGKVGVKFERGHGQHENVSKDERKSEESQKGNNLIEWCDSCDLESDHVQFRDYSEDWIAAITALSEVASTSKPLIIYIPDPREWFERAVPVELREEFLHQVEHKFDQVVGPVVIIAGHTDEEEEEVEHKKWLKTHLDGIRRRLNIKSDSDLTVKELLNTEDIYELFVNSVHIIPPQDEEALQNWNNQLVMHKGISEAKGNLRLLTEVLALHNMECPGIGSVNLYGLHLTSAKAENIAGWARNHLLASCDATPSTGNGKLMIPRDSLERAMTRLRDNDSKKAQPVTKDYKTIAEDEYEKALITAVIPPHEVGVKFDHIGSLENVKQALKELVMLPLQRPELFSKGNLTRPCKGVLLFGPPGTGKTLLAKAVATEAGANFINITGSTITSKWFGDAEKLTKALFSLAKKLSPAVIFVDEVDSLLGARGGSSEHEATRKTRNEFMAAWDGLRSKDNERVLVLAATNRPFDLDDAVIRRLPRRILVDLPTAENRVKILRVILKDEELEPNFDFEGLARIAEGYSGSDLKNLSIAAAYRPIRELLDAEAKAQGTGVQSPQFTCSSSTSVIRALRLDDFREAMTQVGASIAYDASSMNELRRWNEQYGEGGSRKRSTFGFTV